MKVARVKGMRDLLPDETRRFAAAEDAARRIFGGYGYGEIRTPELESTELFTRSVGETTDIVHKEMFTFTDKGGRSLTLRPENTAGVVRAVQGAVSRTGRQHGRGDGHHRAGHDPAYPGRGRGRARALP